LMMQYELSILAIQEQTSWNKDLSNMEVTSIERTCQKWGYTITISKLQMLIIDKQIDASRRDIEIYEEGRIIKCRLEISRGSFVNFTSVYGVPHSCDNYIRANHDNQDENSLLLKMRHIQQQMKK